ncbi:MAG: chemotaxis protein CheW [Alphaproteobacteria bacterium]
MNEAALKIDNVDIAAEGESSYFTVFVNNEIFGLPVENTHTIFRVTEVTPVPNGPADIAGLVNLRGKIVTAVSLRRRLNVPGEVDVQNALAIGIEHKGENFALVVDEVGDVLSLANSMQIPIPSHFDPHRSRLTTGLYRVNKLLIPVLDIEALFNFQN